jgi:hypothetical protein
VCVILSDPNNFDFHFTYLTSTVFMCHTLSCYIFLDRLCSDGHSEQ